MPAISRGAKILVTGASGFIAVHIVKELLKRGYPVTGTVRSTAKGEYLKKLFENELLPFEYVIVDDVSKDRAFDEAVKNCDAVLHTASPFHYNAVHPSELIKPAVDGTIGLLESLKRNNPDIKRIVLTASYAGIVNPTLPQPHRFTEADWNDIDPEICEKEGSTASAMSKYRASKVLAERAFWQWLDTNKPSFDGATINPPLVFGSLYQDIPDVGQLNTSAKHFWAYMSGQKSQGDLPENVGTNWANVEDVARAHVLALEKPEAGNQRFLVSSGPFSGNDFAVFLNTNYPHLKGIPKGVVGVKQEMDKRVNFADGSKASRVLGLDYHSLEETLTALAKDLERFL